MHNVNTVRKQNRIFTTPMIFILTLSCLKRNYNNESWVLAAWNNNKGKRNQVACKNHTPIPPPPPKKLTVVAWKVCLYAFSFFAPFRLAKSGFHKLCQQCKEESESYFSTEEVTKLANHPRITLSTELIQEITHGLYFLM